MPRDLNNFTYSIRGRIRFNSTDPDVYERATIGKTNRTCICGINRSRTAFDVVRSQRRNRDVSLSLSPLIFLFRLPCDRSLRLKILRDRQRMRTFAEQHNRGVRMHAKVPTEASTCLREQWQDLCKSLRASQSRLPFRIVVDQKQTHAMPTSR